MIRRTGFKSKLPKARPCRQYEGERPDAPRAPAPRVVVLESVLVAPIEKAAPVRSESYRRFVATHSCFDCGIAGWSQCAHENVDKGMSLKVCDLRTWPLCGPRYGLMGCHYQFDQYIERTREECRDLGRIWVDRMQALARAAGRPEFA